MLSNTQVMAILFVFRRFLLICRQSFSQCFVLQSFFISRRTLWSIDCEYLTRYSLFMFLDTLFQKFYFFDLSQSFFCFSKNICGPSFVMSINKQQTTSLIISTLCPVDKNSTTQHISLPIFLTYLYHMYITFSGEKLELCSYNLTHLVLGIQLTFL